MPQNRNITLAVGGVWYELTNADVTAITIVNSGSHILQLTTATTGALSSAAVDALILANSAMVVQLHPHEVLTSDIDLAVVWPGLAGAVRVYGRALSPLTVGVSHA